MEEKQNNLNTIIGLGLIFLLLYLWMQYSAPPPKAAQPANQPAKTEQKQAANTSAAPNQTIPTPAQSDSVKQSALAASFGVFAPAATGAEQNPTLENDHVRITFTSKGGRIKEVFFKQYDKINVDSAGNDVKSPVRLLEDRKNRFEYLIPVANVPNGGVNTGDLYFNVAKNGNTLNFRAPTSTGGYLEQSYSLSPDNYALNYQVSANNLQSALIPGQNYLRLNWVNHLDKLERNQTYERTMSSVYYKVNDKDPDYCNCRSNDSKSLGDKPVKWFGHSNQFFNTSIIAQDFSFREFTGETMMQTDADRDLKILRSTAIVPLDNGKATMTIYSGPNEFDRLRQFGVSLEDIIPFGASVFGAINRWVIHPMFEFLSRFVSSQGIVILLLTLLVKMVLYPLTYRMVYSQAKMAALKPRIDELRKKFGSDQQAMSVETMKMYSEFRVNPLGGCLPIFLQMPIWFALYRFFPAAIEFRQASFLWAVDLSSYDVAFKLPTYIMGFGNHVSAFTIIWVITTLWYTWYSMKQMDSNAMAANDQMKMMKYMQYGMPVMFMFFFNTFASGLTLYLCFSNLLNIGQTVVTKQYVINHDKIKLELEANRNKPKKTGGWRERFEQAMKEQQRVQEEKTKKSSKSK